MKQNEKKRLNTDNVKEWVHKVVYLPNKDMEDTYEEYVKVVIINIKESGSNPADCWIYYQRLDKTNVKQENARAWWFEENAFFVDDDWDE